MKRQTRPFTVEIKSVRKQPRPFGSLPPDLAEDWTAPFPDAAPVRQAQEDAAPEFRSQALREAERVFGGLGRPAAPPRARPMDDAGALIVSAPQDAPVQTGTHAPRILPDLFAQARDEERRTDEAERPPSRTRSPAVRRGRPRTSQPAPAAPVATPEIESASTTLPLDPMPAPTDALAAARVEALVRQSRHRAPGTGKLPPGQRWKERRLPRVCWERDTLKR